ncbi:hypothetical protein TRFO_24044 [Tritrichomonas foetus]|uniref:Uncharacterized protein n=1 Tax=Tritrichomonas foetus TaxID=1144522 RepID=A0A1J4KDA5_9EUKA|nr:hypothetical protein TRFO_24044 [Tritrichomonas foetus]|eukprot:OHT07700.1 hypothetical protein TRFO_24044 [Tritrichomonas foetus]
MSMTNKMIAMRPIHPLEKMYASVIPCYINLGIDVEDPKAIPTILERAKNASPPFFMKVKNDTLCRFEKPDFQVVKMPDEITDLEDSLTWALKNCHPNGTDKLATVAVNSSKIVLSYNHGFFSGHMMMNVMNEVQNPTKDLKIPYFPINLDDVFSIHDVKPFSIHYQKPQIAHYANTRVTKPDESDVLQLVSNTFDSRKELTEIYDPKKDVLKGLTEFTAAAYILTFKSFNENLGDWGIQTAYDTVKSLPAFQQTLAPANCVGLFELSINPRPEKFGELMHELRVELNEQMRIKKWLNGIKWVIDGNPEERPRLGLCCAQSNVGQVRIKKPIKDVIMRVSQEDPPNMLNLFMYSVIGEEKNIVKTHLSYGNVEIHKKEVELVNEVFKFAIKNVRKNDKIDDALQMLRDFRRCQLSQYKL